MLRNKITSLLTLMCMLLVLGACSKEELVFEHEKPQFPTKDGAYLLEVIMPQNTNVDDEIYIVGAFNGGDAETVAKDLRWKLEKCENNNVKWGIYLYPGDFEPGTSLANGYTFYNVEQGMERSLVDEPVVHTEAPELGGRINVTVDRWESFFLTPVDPSEIPHDGYAIYVEDKSGWDELAIYGWGSDLPELFGGWPGITPTGIITLGDKRYKYFDTGEANKGLTYNIIFNNNGAGAQFDGPAITLDKDYYFTITDNSYEMLEGDPGVTHDGYAIFVTGSTGWDEIAMYGWAEDMPEIFGGWPGITPTGEQKINGVTYQYFDTGADNKGLFYHFILNNNGGGKQFDMCDITLDRDYYYMLDGSTATEIDPNGGTITPPEPNPNPTTKPLVFYINSTLGWSENALYAWGDEEMFGGWPGKKPDGETVIDGANYLMFKYEGSGQKLNLILNNNGGGQQIDGPEVKCDRDYYFMVTADGWTEVSPNLSNSYRIYIDDQTGWPAIAMYAWGDKEMFGGWPGVQPNGTVKVGDTTFKYFDVTGEGEAENLIFNNNGAGTQLDDFKVVMDRDYWLRVTASGVTEIQKPAAKRRR